MNLFSKRLSELISESGKSQNLISRELQIPKQKLSRWKIGYNEPDLDEIIVVAHYFGVTCDYLLGVDEISEFKRFE